MLWFVPFLNQRPDWQFVVLRFVPFLTHVAVCTFSNLTIRLPFLTHIFILLEWRIIFSVWKRVAAFFYQTLKKFYTLRFFWRKVMCPTTKIWSCTFSNSTSQLPSTFLKWLYNGLRTWLFDGRWWKSFNLKIMCVGKKGCCSVEK